MAISKLLASGLTRIPATAVVSAFQAFAASSVGGIHPGKYDSDHMIPSYEGMSRLRNMLDTLMRSILFVQLGRDAGITGHFEDFQGYRIFLKDYKLFKVDGSILIIPIIGWHGGPVCDEDHSAPESYYPRAIDALAKRIDDANPLVTVDTYANIPELTIGIHMTADGTTRIPIMMKDVTLLRLHLS